jgi:hypothetical protein
MKLGEGSDGRAEPLRGREVSGKVGEVRRRAANDGGDGGRLDHKQAGGEAEGEKRKRWRRWGWMRRKGEGGRR